MNSKYNVLGNLAEGLLDTVEIGDVITYLTDILHNPNKKTIRIIKEIIHCRHKELNSKNDLYYTNCKVCKGLVVFEDSNNGVCLGLYKDRTSIIEINKKFINDDEFMI